MGNCNLSFLRSRPAGAPAEGQSLAYRGRCANFLTAHLPRWKVGPALCLGMIFHLSLQAQCSNGFSTYTYDTSLTSNGFGTYTISAPQWSPDSGTLKAVKISATVSSQYGFTLRNADNSSATYALTLGQDDQINGSALPASYSNVMSQFVNNYPLTPGQSVTENPFVFLNNHVSSDSITNVAPFLGSGQVTLNYLSFTYTDLSTANNATYYYSANINNAIHFSVQYIFCSGGNAILPTTLTGFTALLTAPHTAQLSWSAADETAGRIYAIQRSRDGQNFATLGTVTAQGSATGADYSFTDNLDDSITGNVFYRLQINDQGKLSWSAVQQVTVTDAMLTAPQGFHLFPNPATSFINVTTGTMATDWQVDIFAANGNLVQRTTVLQSSTLHIPFGTKLTAGTYFVRITGLHGQKALSSSFVVVPGY
jgi:Secretion system C-terminal sorting domain